jgi:hypothetical protein
MVGTVLATGVAFYAAADPPAPPTKTPEGKTPPPKTGPASDVEFVERLLAARKDYQSSLEKLRLHYIATGDSERTKWVEDELKQYHLIIKQAYRLDLDVPPPTLRAEYNIPEANKLLRDALEYKGKGSSLTGEHDLNIKRSELLLQQLLTNYPQSNKIGDAAYHLGEIYEAKPYKQPRRAALYYERSFQWNPNEQLDARMKAARLYDRTINDRTKAIELYREAIQHEHDAKRLQEAEKRLAELTGSGGR